jgi:ATP/maltotriose-dependent transcriptional regulator MalT
VGWRQRRRSESWHALAARQAKFARGAGALVHLQFALNYLARAHLVAGELDRAALMIEEDRMIAEATGNVPVAHNAVMLAAWRGREREASELIEATLQGAAAGGQGRLVSFTDCASAVLYNGLGQHDAARDAAQRAFERDQLGYGPLVVPELAEAAARTGDITQLTTVLEWLSERTGVAPTEWALGIENRIRALLSDGEAADSYYRESIDMLGRTRIRVQLARAYLLYGEWLRRRGSRADAREQLRAAHQMLDAMGLEAFAERARRELLATGETVRKRSVPAADVQLTVQETQVARLARDGLSNPQIGARLFISTRTVQYHLSKVFTKLGITSRSQLHRVLPAGADSVPTG